MQKAVLIKDMKLDLQFFREKGACYEPSEVLGENWEGTILEILENKSISIDDRIWAGCAVMDKKNLRLFAVRCIKETPQEDGRKVIDLIEDKRSLNAIDVAERYAKGNATKQELETSWDAARAAARDASRDASRAASRAAAWAAWAAWAASRDTARDAAWAAAWDAAWAAARDAAWDAQLKIMIEMIKKQTV